jgi:hypothetical protein
MTAPRNSDSTPSYELTGLQAESWRLLWQELLRDPAALAGCRAWEERRRRARPAMLDLLTAYLTGAITIEELRATFDQRTRTEWDVFGLRGPSGAMFLNQLVKHAPRRALDVQLQAVLPVSTLAEDARQRLGAFHAYVERLGARRLAAAGAPQAARAVFFVSAWWHLQDTERWPVFQPSAREALRRELDVYTPTGRPVADYFLFRRAFLAVAAALRLTAWELEYLCWWHRERGEAADVESDQEPWRYRPLRVYRERPARVAIVREPGPIAGAPTPTSGPSSASTEPATTIDHTHVQWLLATMGRRLGCAVWVAANDHARIWSGEPLGALSVRALPPLGMSPASQRIVSLIDVVWLREGNEVAAAFEIEHTTAIHSGLLRLADLAALSPNLRFPLYVVTPRERLDKVRRERSRPTFRALGLHRRCAYLSSEALLDAADSLMTWASDPAVIERLASRVGEDGE